MTMRCSIVSGEHAGMRLDTFLAQHFLESAKRNPSTGEEKGGHSERWGRHGIGERPAGLSRSAIQKLIVKGQVTVNGQRTKAGVRLKGSDRIEIQWFPPVDVALEPERIPLHVLYEDEEMLSQEGIEPHAGVFPTHDRTTHRH